MLSPFMGTAFCSSLPGSQPVPLTGKPFTGCFAKWPVLSLNKQKTPGKKQPFRLLLSGVALFFSYVFLPARQAQIKKAGVPQSTFTVKRSTPAKMYVSLSFSVFNALRKSGQHAIHSVQPPLPAIPYASRFRPSSLLAAGNAPARTADAVFFPPDAGSVLTRTVPLHAEYTFVFFPSAFTVL